MDLDQLIEQATEQQLRSALRAVAFDLGHWKSIVDPTCYDTIYGIGVDEAVSSITDTVREELS